MSPDLETAPTRGVESSLSPSPLQTEARRAEWAFVGTDTERQGRQACCGQTSDPSPTSSTPIVVASAHPSGPLLER